MPVDPGEKLTPAQRRKALRALARIERERRRREKSEQPARREAEAKRRREELNDLVDANQRAKLGRRGVIAYEDLSLSAPEDRAAAERERARDERDRRPRDRDAIEEARREEAKARRDAAELRAHGFAEASQRELGRRRQDQAAREAERMAPAKRREPQARPAPSREETFERMLSDEPLSAGLLPEGSLVRNAFREGGEIVRGLPKFGFQVTKAFLADVADVEGQVRGEGFRRTGETIVDPVVADLEQRYGPLAPGGRPARETLEEMHRAPLSTLLDALVVVSAPVAAASKAGKIAKASGGPVERLRASRALPEPRTVRFGEAEAQFPTGASPLANLIRGGYDRLSEARPETPVIGARARVAKQGAKDLRQASRRRAASFQQEVETIRRIEGPARTGFFWEAQMPAELRGGVGLKMVAEDSRRLAERARTQGRARDARRLDIQAAKAEKAIGKRYDEGAVTSAARLMDDRESILRAAGKLPEETAEGARTWLTNRLRGHDLVDLPGGGVAVRAPGTANLFVLERDLAQAKTVLRGEQKRLATLERRFAAPPKSGGKRRRRPRLEQLIARQKASVAEWADEVAKAERRLVDEGPKIRPIQSEGEIYVGHRTKQTPKAVQKLGITRPGLGKTRLPEGIGKRRTGAAYETGRVRTQPKVIIEDWQRAQQYDFHNQAKDFLAKMGEPIGAEGPRAGWFVVNPQGHKLPRQWKDLDEHAKATAEGFKPDQVITHDLREYVNNYVARIGTPEADRLLKAAPSDVVQVPRQAVAQFLNTWTGQAGVSFGGTSKALTGVDITTDLLRASIIYSNPGYIPANLIGNTGFALAKQGPFYLPGNLVRSAKAVHGDKTFRDLLLAEVGMGPSMAIHSGVRGGVGKATFGLAKAVSRVGDDYLRGAAWIHEARRAGYRTEKAQKELLAKAARGDKQASAVANELRDRMQVAMVDFERLTPFERAFAHRALFVWPWIRGATRYPFRFAVDHPARSAIAAHGALESERDPELSGAGLPEWMAKAGAFRVGAERGGLQRVLNPRGTSTVSTPMELVQTLASGLSGEGREGLIDVASPLLRIAANAVTGRNRFGQRVGALEALRQDAETISPLVTTGRELADPSRAAKVYGPQTRAEVLRRRLGRGTIPIQVDAREAAKQAARDLPTPRKITRAHFAWRNEALAAAKKAGLLPKDAKKLPEPLRKAVIARADHMRHRTEFRDRLDRDTDVRDTFHADIAYLRKLGKITPDQARQAQRWLRDASKIEVEREHNRISHKYFNPLYRDAIGDARQKIRDRGVEISQLR